MASPPTSCACLLGPDPAPYRGVYDVTSVFDPPSLGPSNPNAPLGMADVTPDGQLRLVIHFDRYDTLTMRGILANGDFPVTGDFIYGGDVFFEAVGHAATTASGGRRISGSADIRGFGGGTVGTVTFALSRPLAGTPGAPGGSYAASFPDSPSDCGCASGATFDLTVPPDGFATFAPATDARPDPPVVGTFAAGTCLVAPGGSVRCTSPYDPVSESGRAAQCAQSYGGACPVTLHGALPVPPAATGGGTYASPPPPFVAGSWSVTR